MNRLFVIAVCSLGLGACAGSGMPGFEFPGMTPAATTVQFESEPAGAEAKTSQGQACRTPCSMAVAANEFTVTFTQQGYQPQTVPVRISAGERGDAEIGGPPAPRVVPNPVYVELQPAAPPARRRASTAPRQQQARPAPRPPAAAPPPPAPAPAPASPWPPVPSR
jgi:hypothetical protein